MLCTLSAGIKVLLTVVCIPDLIKTKEALTSDVFIPVTHP